MYFNINKISVLDKYCCLILGVFKKQILSPHAKIIDNISNKYVSKILSKNEISGNIGDLLLLYNVPNVLSTRILLVGCGNLNKINYFGYKKIIKNIFNYLKYKPLKKIGFFLNEINVKNISTYWKNRIIVEEYLNSQYFFNKFKKYKKIYSFKKILLHTNKKNQSISKNNDFLLHALAVSKGIKECKDISNLPPNICNPKYLTAYTSNYFKNKNKVKTTILNKKSIKKLNMNAYAQVSNGSNNKPYMSIIKYNGCNDKNSKPIVLIGKGVTFDSGGISLKPSRSMEKMKYDMCGAASVFGIMVAAVELKIPLNIIGVLVSCENMPDGKSLKPGDIIKTMSGKTVEIIDTDAEGRLILCDALTYVEKFNPKIVIDIATLTGACVVALGHENTGLMSNDKKLIKDILKCSKKTHDFAWHLPINDRYNSKLNSHIADIKNISSSSASVITAGCFLSNFAKKYSWAHLDIAGTAWDNSNGYVQPTGRPISLIVQFLLSKSKLNK
ncbi:leucyl aminopeptidase [Buchnera aphidicola (Taiwanaphis decaspermi)]|uniref:leucyl aminopeptidase n=1 Tax=Buchnera aphidicola TaxID=9 RepID=UPI0031B84726